MPKEAVFTMKLEAELRDAFMAEAAELDRPASQIVRDMMKEFIRKQEEERAYDAFLQRKVAAGRADIAAGRVVPQEQVEADARARRERLLPSSDSRRA